MMKLEQQDDLLLLTIYCHASNFFFIFNKYFSNMFYIILQKLGKRSEIFLSIFIVH